MNARAMLRALTAVLLIGPTVRAQTDGHPDRPALGPTPALHFPRVVMRQLSNGARVAILESHGLPIVDVTAIFDLPDAFDPPGKEGVGGIMRAMLTEGTTSLSADQIANATAELGNGVSPFGFMTVTANVEPSLTLMADQLLHPAFPEASLTRIKDASISGLIAAHSRSGYFAGRVFSNVV